MKHLSQKVVIILMAMALIFSLSVAVSAHDSAAAMAPIKASSNTVSEIFSLILGGTTGVLALVLVGGIGLLAVVMIPITFIVIALGFVLLFSSLVRSRKLDRAITEISANPCEETVRNAARLFRETKGIVRTIVSMGGDAHGTHFSMWRDIFNRTVIPSANISMQAKEELRHEMIRFSTYGLATVVAVRPRAETTAYVWDNTKA